MNDNNLSPIERWAAIMVRAGVSNAQKMILEARFMCERGQPRWIGHVVRQTRLSQSTVYRHLNTSRDQITERCGQTDWHFVQDYPRQVALFLGQARP